MKLLLFVLVLITAFYNQALAGQDFIDGIYHGNYSFVDVEVMILDGKISNIDIKRHGGGGKKYADMIQPLAGAVISNQSTAGVDVVTGATVSSGHFLKAVDDALIKARIE